jgi:hypothetical protein
LRHRKKTEADRIKVVKGAKIMADLNRDGWYIVHQKGSHRKFKHPVKKRQRDGKRNAFYGFFWRFAEINRKPVGVDFLTPLKSI